MQLALNMTEDGWIDIRDGDPRLREIYERHYSCYQYADGRKPKKTCGPGQYMALMTPMADAIFIWRKFISKDNQEGINCAVFRNESKWLSSDLIKAAMVRAWSRWPGARLYTYVNALNVRSSNPGCCFKKAGWRECGITKKRGLLILEAFAKF